MKIAFYLDGQNIHHTMKQISIESYEFDFRGYCEDFVKNWQAHEVQIKYYGALYPTELDQYKNNRDSNFFNHLESKQKIVVRRGKFNFDRSGKNKYPPHEKGVDVLLAIDLIIDAFHSKYDQAIIFSNDTDLVPAILEAKKIRSGLRVHNLSRRTLHDFRQSCDTCFSIHDAKLKKFHQPQNLFASPQMLLNLTSKYSTR